MAQTARQMMTKRVITVAPSATVKQIGALLASKNISGVPVVDGGKVLGIVTEHDLLKARGSTMAKTIMKKPVVSVAPDTSLGEIARKLATRKIKRVPVIDKTGHLVGIVSRADVVKAMAGPYH